MPDNDRQARMRRAMEAEGLDVLILGLPENVLLLSGFWPMIGAAVLVFSPQAPPICIIPECYEHDAHQLFENVQTLYYRYGVIDAPNAASFIRGYLAELAAMNSWKRVGYDGSFQSIAPSWNCAEFLVPQVNTRAFLHSIIPAGELIDASDLLQSERSRKTPYEIQKLRTAARISSIGLEVFEKLVQVGASGVELAAAVEHEVMAKGTNFDGAIRVRAFAQVAVGPEESAMGYRPNEISTTRKLAAGEVALLELGVVADGYWADRTRVRVAGEPTKEQLSIFNIVREAQEAAISAIRPGVAAADVDATARNVIRDAGYGTLFPHVTGHGLGFRYHEAQYLLSPDSGEILQEGALVTIEPGIYSRSAGGFRIEDDVLVTSTGSEVLGPYPKVLC